MSRGTHIAKRRHHTSVGGPWAAPVPALPLPLALLWQPCSSPLRHDMSWIKSSQILKAPPEKAVPGAKSWRGCHVYIQLCSIQSGERITGAKIAAFFSRGGKEGKEGRERDGGGKRGRREGGGGLSYWCVRPLNVYARCLLVRVLLDLSVCLHEHQHLFSDYSFTFEQLVNIIKLTRRKHINLASIITKFLTLYLFVHQHCNDLVFIS